MQKGGAGSRVRDLLAHAMATAPSDQRQRSRLAATGAAIRTDSLQGAAARWAQVRFEISATDAAWRKENREHRLSDSQAPPVHQAGQTVRPAAGIDSRGARGDET
jgi:hypothetical protein